jgi:PAS domain S-box-containing protein
MAAKARTHIIISWLVGLLLLVLLLVSRFIILDSFLSLEERDSRDNLQRAINTLNQGLGNLSRTAGDYAGWDDAYQFIADGNKTFIAKSLDPSIYPQLGINLALFMDRNGRVLYGAAFDLEAGKTVPLPPSLATHLTAASPLVAHESEKGEVKGLLNLPEGTLLVASRPIVTSAQAGPVRGAVIMGRWLDEARTRQLAEVANLPLSFASLPPSSEKISSGVAVSRNPDTITAATVIKDIYGTPVRLLRVELPRTIYRQGKFAVLFLGVAIIATVLAFGIISLVLFRRLASTRQQEQSSRRRYHELASLLPQTLFETDSHGRLTFCNDHGLAAFGYTAGELDQGISVFDTIAAEDLPRARTNFARRLAGGQGSSSGEEYTARRRDGSTFPVLIYAHPWGAGDEATGLRGIIIDISERVRLSDERQARADEALRFNHALSSLARSPELAADDPAVAFRALTEASAQALQCETVAIWLYTEDRGAISCEDQYDLSLGRHSSGMELATASSPTYFNTLESREIIVAHDVTTDPRVAELFDSYLSPLGITSMMDCPILVGGRMLGTICHEHKGPGRTWSMEEQGFATAIAGFVAVVLEAHRRHRAEESLRTLNEELERRVRERTEELEGALQRQEAFAYSISHDLRAPLRAVDGYCRIVMEEYGPALPAKAQTMLERMCRSVCRMGLLIDDLLSFSRLSIQPLHRQEVDVQGMVAEVVHDLIAEGERGRIRLTVGDLPPCQADPTLLRQVFINLIGNAIKYSGRKEQAEIEVGATRSGGVTTYHVRDNGAGFDMAYADKLFGVFQRLHGMEEFEGTGVGLAIVQNIVSRHGGTIRAEAQEGKGAAFYFTLE